VGILAYNSGQPIPTCEAKPFPICRTTTSEGAGRELPNMERELVLVESY